VRFSREQVALGLFSISRICQLCRLSKNTYYNHQHPDDSFAKKYAHLKKQIEKIIKADCRYGVKRIKAALLEDYQVHIGRDALARLLRLWSLSLKRKAKKTKRSVIQEILIALSDRVNLLIRTTIAKPFQALSSDITEIIYNNGKNKAYLAVHKDVFGQMVYGFALGLTMEAKLVIDSLEMAKQSIRKMIKKIPDKLLCHSDQGSQYTSYEYTDRVLKSNMILSYSTPGTPTENPGQESFFGRLKEDCQDEFNEIKSFEELEKFIAKRIKYYNTKRIHTSAGFKAPLKFTQIFIK
jgi:transposase InsO family protein